MKTIVTLFVGCVVGFVVAARNAPPSNDAVAIVARAQQGADALARAL